MADAEAGAPAPAAPETRNPFAAPRFARWWLASLLAGTGVGIQAVSVPLFIRDRVALDERAPAIAAALVAQTLPGALLALFGGVVADRVERRRILVRSYGVAALVSLVYVALVGCDVGAIWPVFPLAALVGSAGAFTNPARASLLPSLVSRAQLQNGVILGTMGFMAALQFVGPSVAGLVVDARGLALAFGLEVALLAAAAATFSGIRAPQPPPSGRNVLGDLADGLRYVAREPRLRGLLSLAVVPGIFFIGPFSVTLPLLVPDVFGASDKWVGLLWGCFGAGVVGGSLLLTFRPLPRRGLALCLSNLSGGGVLLLYSQRDALPVAAALLVVWGLTASVFMNYVVTLLQEESEPRMLGRVMSMYSLAFFVAMPIGYALAGASTAAFGTQPTLALGGAGAAAVGLLGLVGLRSVRELR